MKIKFFIYLSKAFILKVSKEVKKYLKRAKCGLIESKLNPSNQLNNYKLTSPINWRESPFF